jgi:hypothetical protein
MMPEETKDNGKLTDEELLKISDIDIQDAKKYCDGDRQRRNELLDKRRIERFTSNPDTFIEISELICAVMRNPKSQLGISVFIGNAKRSEINNSQIELNHRLDLARRQMDIEAEMRKQADKNLIHKPGSFLQGLRNRRK